jgi:mRNA-degrading endonuclease RelE of RelBE toxin-antitoxin system
MTTSTPWEILLTGPARKSLERVPSPDRERIETTLREMVEDAFQGDLKLLKGQQKTFRRRVGSWRIFFSYSKRKTNCGVGYRPPYLNNILAHAS